MLVLKRKAGGEPVVIIAPNGDQIAVAVLETQGNYARLGVSAPKQYGVWRKELWERIQAGEGENDERED